MKAVEFEIRYGQHGNTTKIKGYLATIGSRPVVIHRVWRHETTGLWQVSDYATGLGLAGYNHVGCGRTRAEALRKATMLVEQEIGIKNLPRQIRRKGYKRINPQPPDPCG